MWVPTLTPRTVTAPQTTTLSNGFRVVSFDNASPIASVGLVIEAGTRLETAGTAGISNTIEHLAFQTTGKHTYVDLLLALRQRGIHATSSVKRNHIIFALEGFREHVPFMAGLLHGVVAERTFYEKEIIENAEGTVEVLNHYPEDPDRIWDSLHSAAYGSNTLGHSGFPNKKAISKLHGSDISAWMSQYFTPERMVLVGTGVDHDQMSKLANKYFEDMLGQSTREASQWVGGEVRTHNADAFPAPYNPVSPPPPTPVHVSAAFQAVNWSSAECSALSVLRSALNNKLKKNVCALSTSAFFTPYSDSGIFGVHGAAAGADGDRLINDLASLVKGAATATVSQQELAQAKASALSELFARTESRAASIEDLGRSALAFGNAKDPLAIVAELSAVSAESVQQSARKLLTTPLAFAAVGDLSAVPKFSSIDSAFRV